MLELMQCVQVWEWWDNTDANAMCIGVGVVGEC